MIEFKKEYLTRFWQNVKQKITDSTNGLQKGIIYISNYTLLSSQWVDNSQGGADYTITKSDITPNHVVNVYIKAEDQDKMGTAHTETKSGSFLIHALEKPTDNIDVNFEIKLETEGNIE